jgi:hypothetical protein
MTEDESPIEPVVAQGDGSPLGLPGVPPGTDPSRMIDMSNERMTCPVHGEPFREHWPKGYGVYCVWTLRALLNNPAFIADVERLGGDYGEDFKLGVERALDELPACCRLGPVLLFSAYHAAQEATAVWRPSSLCVACGQRERLVCRYTYINDATKQTRTRAVCLECVATWPGQRRDGR